MVTTLPAPKVLRNYFDDEFEPQLPAMWLRWEAGSPDLGERLWELPEGVCVTGPAPERFGLRIQRRAADAYAVRLLWNQTRLSWSSLKRVQLLTSSLAPLLSAIGTDLWYLLDQPISSEVRLPRKAA
jgi:hypothetical protein